jgi:hypothetical protein
MGREVYLLDDPGGTFKLTKNLLVLHIPGGTGSGGEPGNGVG